MLPRNRRVPRKMFSQISGGKVFKNNIFLLRSAVSSQEPSQFSFSVSKKVAKDAVVRNSLRRQGYRMLAGYLPLLKPNTIFVFYFRSIPKNEKETAEKLEALLKESKLIK